MIAYNVFHSHVIYALLCDTRILTIEENGRKTRLTLCKFILKDHMDIISVLFYFHVFFFSDRVFHSRYKKTPKYPKRTNK